MSWLDIIFLVVSIVAIYRGFRSGLVVELCGLIGVVTGGYLAYVFSDSVISMLEIDHTYSSYVAFAIIMILTLIAAAILARFISRLLKATGFGTINRVLGAIVSFTKGVLILSLLFIVIEAVNNSGKFIPEQQIEQSKTFKPTIRVGNAIFPYIVEFAAECSTTIEKHISELEASKESEH